MMNAHLMDCRNPECAGCRAGDPSLSDFRQMVAAIGVGIEADERTMSGLMQAAKIGWEYGSGRKVRRRSVPLVGS